MGCTAVSQEGPGPSSSVSCPLLQGPLPPQSVLQISSQSCQCAWPRRGCIRLVSPAKDGSGGRRRKGPLWSAGSRKRPVKPEVAGGPADRDPGILHWAHQV